MFAQVTEFEYHYETLFATVVASLIFSLSSTSLEVQAKIHYHKNFRASKCGANTY